MEWSGEGGVEGRSERSAGGGAGPIMRRRFEPESVEELCEGGDGCGEGVVSSSSLLRFESRWGGS